MMLPRQLALGAALIAFCLSPSSAQTMCKPRVELRDVQFSNVSNLKRYWTAAINVDASTCATSSGLFSVSFLRWGGSGPDLEFTEPFLWNRAGGTVRLEFWADEAVGHCHVAEVAVCPCKAD
jgi:hypothetical protein